MKILNYSNCIIFYRIFVPACLHHLMLLKYNLKRKTIGSSSLVSIHHAIDHFVVFSETFFREFYGSRNLIHLRSLLYICCFFQDFPSICLKVFYMQSLNKLYIKGRLKCKVQLIIYCLNNRRP